MHISKYWASSSWVNREDKNDGRMACIGENRYYYNALVFCIGFDCCYNRPLVNQKVKSSRTLRAA